MARRIVQTCFRAYFGKTKTVPIMQKFKQDRIQKEYEEALRKEREEAERAERGSIFFFFKYFIF